MKGKNLTIYHFYFAYTLSCLSDRLWEFAVIFILEKIGGLKLIAISQLLNGLCTIVLSGILGKWIDKQNRMKSICFVLFINNIFISLCVLIYMIILRMNTDNTYYDLLMYIGLLLNGISEIASDGERMLLSKDWILVLINNDQSKLCEKNATMTTLDQSTCIVAPIFIGILLKNFNYDIICLIFMIWNLISWIAEYLLIKKLYNNNISLHEKSCDDYIKNKEKISLSNVISIYFSQSTCYQALALSLLYMTVLAFDGLSLAYAKAHDMSEDILGIFRGISSLTGIIGAFIYMKLERKIGASIASLCGLFIQQSFNYCCLISLIIPGTLFDPIGYFNEWNFTDWSSKLLMTSSHSFKLSDSPNSISLFNNPSIWVYLITIIVSRIGLWLVDLAITHQMQQSVKDNDRGAVFGFQNSLCSFFSTIKDIFVILLPDVRTFGILMIISVAFGTISLLLGIYSYTKNKIMKK
uniref:Solute carrier family 40 member n=1 Tax=Strongyloides venezuelensis TaxID=75913 RepID=A0A0K0FTW1_STRVS